MRILLTGATGFIGSAFARLARTHGHSIVGLALPTEPLPAALENDTGVQWVRGTLGTAPWAAIESFSPEICVHTAWITTPGVYLESPENERFRDSSLAFVRRATQMGVSHVLALGTCIEYEIAARPLSEELTPIKPTTRYARCKNELRIALESESRPGNFSFCWARVFYPYGPGEHRSRLCSSLLEKLTRGEQVVLKTPDSTKDYIYIEDVAAALMTLVDQRYRGAINLGTGFGITVREIAQTLAALVQKPGLVQEPERPEPDPFPFVVAEGSRLRKLGWVPRISLPHGLEALLRASRASPEA